MDSIKVIKVHTCVHVAGVVVPCCVSKELAGSEQSGTSCQETLLLIAQSGCSRGGRGSPVHTEMH